MFSKVRENSQRVKLFKLLKINKKECKFFQTKLVSKRKFKNNLLENWEFKTRNNEKIPAYFIKPKEKKNILLLFTATLMVEIILLEEMS